MDKRAIFLAIGLLAASAVVADVAYRWVDENGVAHYSDRPREGAELVVLPAANTTSVRRYEQAPTEATAETETAAPARYDSFEISTPGAEETLWNIEGNLSVSLSVSPALKPGHQVRVYFNSREPQIVPGLSFSIQEVHRGVHTIQAEIIDDTGKLVTRSKHNRFYVQQNTVRR